MKKRQDPSDKTRHQTPAPAGSGSCPAAAHEISGALREWLAVSPLPIVAVDPAGVVQIWNPAAAALFGWSEAEVLGRPLPIVPPDKSGEYRQILDAQRKGQYAAGRELRRQRKDGTPIDMQLWTAPLRGSRGRITGFIGMIVDVTARKRAEDRLHTSEERYRAVVEDQTEIICRFKADGTFTFVNDVFCRFFGKTSQELLGKKWQPQVVAEDLPRVEAQLCNLSPANPVMAIENRGYSGTGEERWMQFVNRAFFDAAGRLIETQSVGRDITERKQAEEALRASEERFRTMFMKAPIGVALATADHRLEDVNESFCQMLGYSRSELLGRSVLDVTHPDDRAPDVAASAKVAQGASAGFQREKRFMKKNGTVLWTNVVAAPIKAPDGKPLFRLGMVEDITVRKCTEDELRRASEEWELTFNAVPDLIMVLNRDFRIVRANRALAARLGYGATGLFGRHCYELVHGTDRPPDFCPHAALLRDGQEHTIEITDAQLRGTFALTSTPLRDARGEVWGAVHVAHDITERKRMENALRASREQLRALAARQQAVREEERTRVAREIHDVLAQELTRLKIDLVWLQGRLRKRGNAAAKEALATRVAEMTQMADATIHCVQRIATGLRPAVLDCLGLCAAVEWQARDFQEHAGISCQVRVPAVELPIDRDGATAVFRIVQECLTNVQRHAKATHVDLSLAYEAGQLILKVRDNGCGIREATLNNPMAIGLAGMRERALVLGGQCEIRSQSGGGTTIEVRLPLEVESILPGRAGSPAVK